MTHSYRFPTIQSVISHLQNAHNMEIGNQTHSFENFTNSMNGKYKRRKLLNHTTYRIRQLNCMVVLSTGISTVIDMEQDALEVNVNN